MNKLNYPANKKNIWFSNLVKPIIDKINEIIDKVKDDSGGGNINITNTDDNLTITNDENNVNINLNSPVTLNRIIKFYETNPYPEAPDMLKTELRIGNSDDIIMINDIYNDIDSITIGFPNYNNRGYVRVENTGSDGTVIYLKANLHIDFMLDNYGISLNATDLKKLREILNNYTLQNP